MNPEKHEKELVNRNILVKKGLWLAFIERKEMNSKDFKELYNFKPKAVAGFLKFLMENHLATKTGYDKFNRASIWKIEEEVIPFIKEILKYS